jgi:hypothetical protein
MLRRVVWYKFTDISEVLAASIIRAMMMEAASISETSVNFYQTTQRNIPEDSHLHGNETSGEISVAKRLLVSQEELCPMVIGYM